MDIGIFFAYIIIMTEYHLAASLLNWYQHHGRSLPWRVKGGAHPDPYVVLVSEFMLQQTTVKTSITPMATLSCQIGNLSSVALFRLKM